MFFEKSKNIFLNNPLKILIYKKNDEKMTKTAKNLKQISTKVVVLLLQLLCLCCHAVLLNDQ